MTAPNAACTFRNNAIVFSLQIRDQSGTSTENTRPWISAGANEWPHLPFKQDVGPFEYKQRTEIRA